MVALRWGATLHHAVHKGSMRLSKIKLAGFKSFVDPTTIVLPSNLVGVVGPNGCGKSNVIDAVRWVMGETSAKNLRGESMADVIFNGSANRKPIGAATIELVFDNADGVIGGQFANYGEVAVRRTVTRDGQSQYFLNNVRCRRKDITHIFLGTGLGPRSYAIIEQGMISRLIEAKPEEMRAHLEEAAGISKYKERRRETENRIRHTRDNLDRLNDLREEVENQLAHLQKQARAAERHTALKDEQRQVQAELLAIDLKNIDARVHEEGMALARQKTELEAAIAAQRRVETEIEEARQQQILAGDELNATTARHYSVDLEISHLEQAIEHNRATRERQQMDLEEANQRLADISAEISQDEAQLRELDKQLEELAPGVDEVQRKAQTSSTRLDSAEKELARWQENWNAFSEELNQARRVVEVETARIGHLHEKQEQLSQRRASLDQERGSISLNELEDRLAALIRAERELGEREQQVTKRFQETVRELEALRRASESAATELQDVRGELDSSRARLGALETLQRAALGGDEASATEWLEAQQLGDRKRLAQKLEVADGWQTAVETVLGDFLQAVSVEKVDKHLRSLPDANVLLFEDDALKYAEDGKDGYLLAHVRNAGPAADMLSAVRTAASLNEAMALRGRLAHGESIITPEGVWLSRNWVRVSRGDAEAGGVLTRETEMREIKSSMRSLESRLASLTARQSEAKAGIERQEAAREQLHDARTKAAKEHGAAAARLAALRAEFDKSRQRSLALGEDSQNIEQSLDEVANAIRESEAKLASAAEQSGLLDSKVADLQGQQLQLLKEVESARAQAEADREEFHSLTIKVQSQRSSRESATTTLERALSQRGQLMDRVESLKAHLAGGEAPLAELQDKLQAQLALKVTVDDELRGKHEALEQANNGLREQETRRSEQEKKVSAVRESADTMRMAVRELEIRRENIAERFAATGMVLEEVQQGLPADYTPEAWNARLEKIQTRLDRIGTVNLLAIEEFEEQSERAKYLEEQHADLSKALDTLERAIRKIDKETRQRFQEVFDAVNVGLKKLFPRLFGGGHAYMSLEGDDLLNAGVTVMAQPPGKRNSSIHLLSGGEKALTAVALVFSIFELNPAPFCLLDEVDAPLDDANVGRFCDIVREMSANVQFLFITHNKVTMEMASQLTGVTMGEPGVSRLVSVDIDEAVKLAG